MRRFIVATHAYMSKGIVSSLELIMGKQQNVTFICAYVEKDRPFQRDLEKELDSYGPNDEVVIFTDLFGGSVNNEVIQVAAKRDHIYVVTGINLILLISIILASEESNIEEIIRLSIDEARKGMMYCNDKMNECCDSSLDEF